MNFNAERKKSENHQCCHCDIGDRMIAEIERLRTEIIRLEKDNEYLQEVVEDYSRRADRVRYD